MRLFAGIDGGQSSSSAVIGDERGRVLTRATGSPTDLVGEPPESRRRADAIDELLAQARQSAGVAPDEPFDAIVAGLSGFDGFEPPNPAPRTPARRWRFTHDSEIAHAGAFGGEPGIVVIAGTGSVALGIARDGRRALAGGWGYLFGDEGSAFWVAREALRGAMHARDRRTDDFALRTHGSFADLERRALDYFGVTDLRAIQHGFAAGSIARGRVAGFAPEVVAAAQAAAAEGSAAGQLCLSAGAHLVGLAHSVDDALGPEAGRRVAFVGGVFDGAGLPRPTASHVRRRIPQADVVAPLEAPVLGALRLAYRDGGIGPVVLVEPGAPA
ncbi:MAG: BadF/BadG/BcrA/BcrD ATPase family protein [Vulcanimicrobiaceae bacterium]